MPYKRFYIEKRFPRWNCNQYEGFDYCGHEFYENFEGRNSDTNKCPDVNPLEKAVFDTRQGPFDIYRYTYKGELRDDLSFVYFHSDFSGFVDFKNSEFWLVPRDFTSAYVNKQDYHSLIENDNIRIDSSEDYEEKATYYSIEKKLMIWEKRICCPEAMKYDMFPIIRGPFAWGVYVSDRLQQRLEKEKMKGVNYSRNIFYEFGCAG
ncbi:MAG: hypothetical protein IPG32_19475 [Saprospirales bacterium]|nr:hypothetical protein [Saprospirales bacterium]